jgi:hypothetical protein
MNATAEKIIKVFTDEIDALSKNVDDWQKRYGVKWPARPLTMLVDNDYVEYTSKISVLKQCIRTIEGMERRGEI